MQKKRSGPVPVARALYLLLPSNDMNISNIRNEASAIDLKLSTYSAELVAPFSENVLNIDWNEIAHALSSIWPLQRAFTSSIGGQTNTDIALGKTKKPWFRAKTRKSATSRRPIYVIVSVEVVR